MTGRRVGVGEWEVESWMAFGAFAGYIVFKANAWVLHNRWLPRLQKIIGCSGSTFMSN